MSHLTLQDRPSASAERAPENAAPGGAAKGLFIKTYGCQMNVYDSERMHDLLKPLGFALCPEPEQADLVILNTCHIREKASEKVFSELGRLNRMDDRRTAAGGPRLLAVAGCVAQAEGGEILRRAPQVDLVFGPQTYHRLPELVARALGGERGLVEVDFPAESKFDSLPQEGLERGPAAFLSVQEGCDKFCTFCVVPYTRGAEFSRPVTEIAREARQLVAAGAVELTLLGQNVNAYHGAGPDSRDWGLGRLLRVLAEIEGLARLRYTTSHPIDVDEELIAAHRDLPQLMPFLHLPVQSGSDRVLSAMNRKHDAALYYRVVEQLRAARPDLALSSDFIVGFPGESDTDFAATLRLVTDIGFAQAYSFKYSPRPGTPAAGEAQLPEDLKAERLAMLQELLNAQQLAFNQASVGSRQAVLFEKQGKFPGQLVGRSPYMQAVAVEAPERLIGHILPVQVTTAQPNSLRGEMVAGEMVTGESALSATPRQEGLA